MASIGCDGEVATEPAPSQPPEPERVAENNARIDPAAPCTTGMPSASSFCSLPFEEPTFELVDQSSTTQDGCTQLYVASRAQGETIARVRRYKMTGVDVCGFARDETFGEVTSYFSAISATSDGSVFALGPRRVQRIAPGPVIDCVAQNVTVGDQALLAMAPSGATGYVVWNKDHDPRFGKVNVSESGCEVVEFLVHERFERVVAITVDAADRLHLIAGPLERNMVYASRGYIFGTDGAPSSTYDFGLDMADPRAITPCGSGTCIQGWTLASFNLDGRLLNKTDEMFRDDLFYGMGHVGSPGGPLSMLGMAAKSIEDSVFD